MAAISEKILWPIVGIFIFGVLAGFYIDDRRRMAEEGTSPKQEQASSKEHGGKKADAKHASSEHAGEAAKSKEHGGQAAENKSAEKARMEARAKASSNKNTADASSTGATSMSMDEYLSSSSGERSAELEANVTHHQGFSGGIDEYLSGGNAKAKNNAQEKSETPNASGQQAAGATSMSMDEYQAKASGSESSSGSGDDSAGQASGNSGAYHGDIDGYLAKYGDGKQTEINTKSEKPFNQKEHRGFHGSYEEYAKKFN